MATRTTSPVRRTSDGNRWIAWAIGAVIVVAMLALTFTYTTPEADDPALAKADELIALMEDAGMQAPEPDVVARTYGTDGGAACTMTGAELSEFVGALNVQRAGGEVNGRPGFVDPRVVLYGSMVIDTYCPECADDYDDFVRGLRVRRTQQELPG